MTWRDSQREKLYRAERSAFHGTVPPPMTVDEMQKLVNRVWAPKVIQRRYPTRTSDPPRVTDGRGRSRTACYEPFRHEIRMPRFARKQYIVLHEIAHALTWSYSEPNHGWRFAECFVYLVEKYIGKNDAARLRLAFKHHAVKFRKPRTVTISDEERQRRRERMIAMRAKRAQGSATPAVTAQG